MVSAFFGTEEVQSTSKGSNDVDDRHMGRCLPKSFLLSP